MHDGRGLSHMVVLDHSVLDDEKCDKAVVCAFHYPKVPHVVPCHIMPYSSYYMPVCPFRVLGSSSKSCVGVKLYVE